ncbi:Hsp33 family molecular chaperone HslO [Latilactobacillus sakei subsp. carnosus]|uniref:Hsp33 family molecular chaperone HslO n=1 Tax=Latilactobacillus TaxID=2767885 RepID=UPI000C1250CD|nr:MULTISPECIES: Hsp33 family molecular chaperone HslO [Latilactobacillus]MCM1571490.1 Hsp33 family molecular chaperone HslO [Latilactobacillus sakei]MDV8938206.1 Hsp33 family molecular chaperone HslO [Latilactobacillus sp.]MDV8939872.1 Hsp33 family molecular chaperone HslO [Latilactobacillus sp.]MDV8941656.1 Hsp33 family molecular chaperone HslO [Latilactobacillus sp.]MDV8943511.1 Hsp33 family molecular chaperone HslO [Latilactobacillus sp.]
MKDYLVKQVSEDGQLRAYAVNATQVITEAQEKHDTWPTSSAAFGRTIVGTLLLSAAGLKGDTKMTVKVEGDGPVGKIVVDGNAQGTVKGYVTNPHVNLPSNEKNKIDVKAGVGTTGTLSVTKDLGLKEPFTGQVPLVSGELGEDFTYYLAKSEQTPSAVGVSVFVNEDSTIGVAGGFMIQILPGADDRLINILEARLQEMPLVSELLQQGMTPEEIITEIVGELPMKTLEELPVKYECDCSKERFAKALSSIAPQDLKQLIEEDHGAEATCRFCGKQYQFSEADLKAILAEQ